MKKGFLALLLVLPKKGIFCVLQFEWESVAVGAAVDFNNSKVGAL
jgi:hypothetical protein